MKSCPQCGHQYTDEHNFCGGCGIGLEPMVSEYRFCPRCGIYYAEEHLFCGSCGVEMERSHVSGSAASRGGEASGIK